MTAVNDLRFKFNVGDTIMREPLLGKKLFWWSIILGCFYDTKERLGYLIVTTLGKLKFDELSVITEGNILKGIPATYLVNENFVTDIAGFIFAKNRILKNLQDKEIAEKDTKKEIIWPIYEDDLLKYISPESINHLETTKIYDFELQP